MLFELVRKIVVGEEVTEDDLTKTLKEWCNTCNCGDCPINEDNLNSTRLFPSCDCLLDGEKMLMKMNEMGYFKEVE